MIIQQWSAVTTTRHSYTLTYQLLTDLHADVSLGLELLRDIQFGCLRDRERAWLRTPVAEPLFLNF